VAVLNPKTPLFLLPSAFLGSQGAVEVGKRGKRPFPNVQRRKKRGKNSQEGFSGAWEVFSPDLFPAKRVQVSRSLFSPFPSQKREDKDFSLWGRDFSFSFPPPVEKRGPFLLYSEGVIFLFLFLLSVKGEKKPSFIGGENIPVVFFFSPWGGMKGNCEGTSIPRGTLIFLNKGRCFTGKVREKEILNL